MDMSIEPTGEIPTVANATEAGIVRRPDGSFGYFIPQGSTIAPVLRNKPWARRMNEVGMVWSLPGWFFPNT